MFFEDSGFHLLNNISACASCLRCCAPSKACSTDDQDHFRSQRQPISMPSWIRLRQSIRCAENLPQRIQSSVSAKSRRIFMSPMHWLAS